METMPVYWVIPFVLILLSIAILPLIVPHFWEHNKNKAFVCIGLALPTAIFLILHDHHALLESAHEYVSFIALLASLFIVSGGIFLQGDLRATPRINTAFLAIGATLASIIGTTGASMLLIRPLLKTNSERKNIKHIPIFFIFIVSNIGGLLTPIGDPPLFLGFLRGVPFFWTLKLIPVWLLANSILLTLFFFIDRRAYSQEKKKDIQNDNQHVTALKVNGSFNFILLAGIIVAVFLPTPYREAMMIIWGVISIWLTPKKIRQDNRFTFHPIIEVTVIFAGIFIAMVPALELLRIHSSQFGLSEPYQFFWLSGSLSSFLDNAPTYLTFFAMAQGLSMPGANIVGITEPILKAISCGAVLMGANTYIGNGPNFMVKAISDEAGVQTPSFFGYMAYSLGILGPLFLLITFVFFVG